MTRGRARPARARLAVLLALLVALAPTAGGALAQPAPPEPLVEGPVADWPAAPEVDASAYVLLDAASGQVLAARDAARRRPVASTVKVLTALTVLDDADLEAEVTVGEEVQVGGASVGLEPGETWTVEQLLDGLLIRSGNDAAMALAAHVAGGLDAFVERMRDKAAALGVEGAVIESPSGLEDANRLSARDLARIARAALAHDGLRPLLRRRSASLPDLGEVENRNLLLGELDGATGVKTGFTDAAGNSLIASARRDGTELIAVVLDAGDDPARFEQGEALLEHGFGAYGAHRPEIALTLLAGGAERRLEAGPERVLTPDGAPPELAPLPPTWADPGRRELDLLVADEAVATLPAEVSGDREDSPRLGASLAAGAHAAMRAATAADAW